jgi:hypothetical protein
MNTALANNNGELVIPVIVTGTLNKPIIAPDVQQLAQMKLKGLLPTSGNPGQLIGGLLGGGNGQQGGAAGGVSGLIGALGGKKQQQQQPNGNQQQPQQQQQPAGNAVDQLLGAFGKKKPK